MIGRILWPSVLAMRNQRKQRWGFYKSITNKCRVCEIQSLSISWRTAKFITWSSNTIQWHSPNKIRSPVAAISCLNSLQLGWIVNQVWSTLLNSNLPGSCQPNESLWTSESEVISQWNVKKAKRCIMCCNRFPAIRSKAVFIGAFWWNCLGGFLPKTFRWFVDQLGSKFQNLNL